MACATSFAPHVQSHIKYIMKNSFGLGHKRIAFMNPMPSCPIYLTDAKCDRFKIIIPCAGMPVECLVIFQSSGPECPPDFLFPDPTFFVPMEEMKTLRSWDVNKPEGLFLVLKELMQFYKQWQITLLERYDHISFQYLTLTQVPNLEDDDIEVMVPTSKEIPVTFLIRLRIDFNEILPTVFHENSNQEKPLLLVFFPVRESSRSNQRLYLSEKVSNALKLSENFRLPPTLDHCLGSYIPVLENELRKKAALVASGYEKRKIYIAALLSHFEHCLIEYDAHLFLKLSLLLERDGFIFLLEFNIPQNFPFGVPNLIFRSIYHSHSGQPVSVVMNSYPYSSNWTTKEILSATIKFIESYSPLFQKDSIPQHSSVKTPGNKERSDTCDVAH